MQSQGRNCPSTAGLAPGRLAKFQALFIYCGTFTILYIYIWYESKHFKFSRNPTKPTKQLLPVLPSPTTRTCAMTEVPGAVHLLPGRQAPLSRGLLVLESWVLSQDLEIYRGLVINGPSTMKKAQGSNCLLFFSKHLQHPEVWMGSTCTCCWTVEPNAYSVFARPRLQGEQVRQVDLGAVLTQLPSLVHLNGKKHDFCMVSLSSYVLPTIWSYLIQTHVSCQVSGLHLAVHVFQSWLGTFHHIFQDLPTNQRWRFDKTSKHQLSRCVFVVLPTASAPFWECLRWRWSKRFPLAGRLAFVWKAMTSANVWVSPFLAMFAFLWSRNQQICATLKCLGQERENTFHYNQPA